MKTRAVHGTTRGIGSDRADPRRVDRQSIPEGGESCRHRHQRPVDGVAVKKARGYTIWAFRSRLSRLLCAGLQLPGYDLQAAAEALRLETAHQMRRGGKGCVSGGMDVIRVIFELGSGDKVAAAVIKALAAERRRGTF